MKDLTFMNDGNQTFLAGEMVNFEKNRAINGKINDIRSSQQSTYTFDINQGNLPTMPNFKKKIK